MRLADSLPPHVRFGTSSWTFRGWQGLVYRRKYSSEKEFTRESLREYASHPLFQTVGIDRSHYAPLSAQEWRDYADQLPDGFRCAAKVWDEITTMVFPDYARFTKRRGKVNPRFLDADYFSETVAAPLLQGFQKHLGPQILEISPERTPPDPKVFEHKLETFLARAPGGLHYAIELRNPTLLTPRYFEILRHFSASHVLNF